VVDEMRGTDPNLWPTVAPDVIQDFFAQRAKYVIYFAGYGELGYQDRDCVGRTVQQVLNGIPVSSALVHCGTLLRRNGLDGIADVYAVAKELGFETTGIHPSIAKQYSLTHRVSPYCDHVFFVPDDTWGGLIHGTQAPSATLRLHLAVSDEIVIVGGGKHTADEMMAFAEAEKAIRYFPAEMNASASRGWCEEAGIDLLDTRGAAQAAWDQLRR
jgi:hypothetical protein